LVDQKGFEAVDKSAQKTKEEFDKGNFEGATSMWSKTETVISTQAGNVDFYNILKPIGTRFAFKGWNFVITSVTFFILCCVPVFFRDEFSLVEWVLWKN